KLSPHDLAGRSPGQPVEHRDAPWNLEGGNMFSQETPELEGGRGGRRAKHNNRRNVFTETRMRACKGGRLGDGWVEQQGCFDFDWRNLLAATVDQLLDPTVQDEKTVLVETSDVTRAKPAIDE